MVRSAHAFLWMDEWNTLQIFTFFYLLKILKTSEYCWGEVSTAPSEPRRTVHWSTWTKKMTNRTEQFSINMFIDHPSVYSTIFSILTWSITKDDKWCWNHSLAWLSIWMGQPERGIDTLLSNVRSSMTWSCIFWVRIPSFLSPPFAFLLVHMGCVHPVKCGGSLSL